MRTSKERVRRLMREHDLQAPPRAGHAHGPKAHDGTITTETPDVMWGTDMTATVTVAEGAAVVFVAVDHAKRGNRFEALEPIRQGIPKSPWLREAASCGKATAGRTSKERFIRTLKENLLWVRFETIEELALLEFKRTYNWTWRSTTTEARPRARDLLGLDAAA